MMKKRKNSDDRLSNSSSMQDQLAHRHHSHSHHHNHNHHRRKSESSCPFTLQFITFVTFYFVGSFGIILYTMMGMATQIHEPSMVEYHEEWHPKNRIDRFPSIGSRVKLYMSIWYLPPCDEKLEYSLVFEDFKNYTRANVAIKDHSYTFHGVIRRDLPLYLDPYVVSDCMRGSLRVLFERARALSSNFVADRSLNRPLCADVSDLVRLKPGLATLGKERSGSAVPVFGAWRAASGNGKETSALADDDKTCNSNPPVWHPDDLFPTIIWRLHSRRQYDLMTRSSHRDRPWENKINKAIWRSLFMDLVDDGRAATAAKKSGTKQNRPTNRDDCMADSICNLVFQHAGSQLIDAGYGADLTHTDKLDGVKMTRQQSGLRTQQYHKVLIHFHEFDYGTSLAWKLYSKSILLMPPPTKTTWFMEELLEPWVHYLPLNDTNAEAMVQWVIDNDEKAHMISERASLFVHDLLLHPKAMDDEEEVKREMMKRYQAHWQPSN